MIGNDDQDAPTSEKAALGILIQIYLSHTSKWYSALLASVLGTIGFPLLTFSIKMATDRKVASIVLHLVAGMTVVFVLFSLYLLHKVFYSLQFLEELLGKLKMAGDCSVGIYNNDLQMAMRARSTVFRHLVRRDKGNKNVGGLSQQNKFYWLSYGVAIIGGIALLILIFWPIKSLFPFVIWGGLLALLTWVYRLLKLI